MIPMFNHIFVCVPLPFLPVHPQAGSRKGMGRFHRFHRRINASSARYIKVQALAAFFCLQHVL